MNFFKLYIGDYQRDTAHLSIAEHGAYMLMLQHYYATEKPLPSGKALHRMLRAQDKSERDAIDSVSSKFWTTTDAGLVNARCDKEITKANAQAETNAGIAREREARRKAARNDNDQSTNRATNDQPNHNQTPDTRHQEEIHPPTPLPGEGDPPGFAAFWGSWPSSARKVGRKACADKWRKKKLGAVAEEIMAHVEAMKLTEQWVRGFDPAPMTYLGQERWRDGIGEAESITGTDWSKGAV